MYHTAYIDFTYGLLYRIYTLPIKDSYDFTQLHNFQNQAGSRLKENFNRSILEQNVFWHWQEIEIYTIEQMYLSGKERFVNKMKII